MAWHSSELHGRQADAMELIEKKDVLEFLRRLIVDREQQRGRVVHPVAPNRKLPKPLRNAAFRDLKRGKH